jgi:hypothetical protein
VRWLCWEIRVDKGADVSSLSVQSHQVIADDRVRWVFIVAMGLCSLIGLAGSVGAAMYVSTQAPKRDARADFFPLASAGPLSTTTAPLWRHPSVLSSTPALPSGSGALASST